MSREALIDALKREVEACRKCNLWKNRTNVVVGEGPLNAEIMLIGEAPGKVEDETGRPFVGPAGKLLDTLLLEAGLRREEVYITNIVKCRPPGNRDPSDYEVKACTPYLERQILIIRPRVIVALGRHSAAWLYSRAGLKFRSITRERGGVHRIVLGYPLLGDYVKAYLIPTLHPASALYNPSYRVLIMEDLKLAAQLIKKG